MTLPKVAEVSNVVMSILRMEGTMHRSMGIIHYLLDVLDSQLRIAESSGCGLLVVSVTGPFYPLLNIIRSLLHDAELSLPSR